MNKSKQSKDKVIDSKKASELITSGPFQQNYQVSMGDRQDTAFIELPSYLNPLHRIDYIACLVDVPAGQTVRGNIETPNSFAPLIMINQGTYPTNRTIFVASQQVVVPYEPLMGGETTPLPSRRVQIWRSAAIGESLVRVFIRGTFE